MNKIYIPIGGIIRQSLIDYPGFISTVIFVKGCNFRCFYCHNPELVLPELIRQQPDLDIKDILSWINENSVLLDAVVITGGEPTLYPDLIEFVKLIKSFSLKIKLDTNGTNPEILKYLIDNNIIDYIAMDIKAPLNYEKYKKITGEYLTYETFEKIINSINIIKQGKIDYEFRTTLNHLIKEKDLIEIINSIKGKFFIQKLNTNNKVLNSEITKMTNQNIDFSYILNYARTINNVTVNIRD